MKKISMLIALAIVGGILVGCSGGDTASTEGTKTDTAAPATDAPAKTE